MQYPVVRCKTPAFAHHDIAFSPFYEDRLAVGSGSNFGLVGNGRVHILQLGQGGLRAVKWFDTQDSVYAIAWNEVHENQVMAGCGNGSLRLFDITLDGLPVARWHEHTGEIMSVDWSNNQKDQFITGSWDHSIKVWSVQRQTSLMTISDQSDKVYAAKYSPILPSSIASTGASGLVKIHDLRTQVQNAVIQFQALNDEVLDLDWNKYKGSVLVTAGRDGAIREWDARSPSRPMSEMRGHTLAARKVAYSPHHADVLASTSYDMTCRTWRTAPPAPSAQLHCHSQHTEFVMGTAWSLFDKGLLATCAWDHEVHLYRP